MFSEFSSEYIFRDNLLPGQILIYEDGVCELGAYIRAYSIESDGSECFMDCISL